MNMGTSVLDEFTDPRLAVGTAVKESAVNAGMKGGPMKRLTATVADFLFVDPNRERAHA